MRVRKSKKLYNVTLVFSNNLTRTVMVQASSRETAEKRALKRNPGAVAVQRHA